VAVAIAEVEDAMALSLPKTWSVIVKVLLNDVFGPVAVEHALDTYSRAA
jgi:hypothetical protein